MTTYLDSNDRTVARPCAAEGCDEEFVPSLRGPMRAYCSPRCKKRIQRARDKAGASVYLASFYGTGSPDLAPSPLSVAALAEEYGIDWSTEFTEYQVDHGETEDDRAERRALDGLVPMVEERPLGLAVNGHKRLTDGETVVEGGGLPPDVSQAAAPGAGYGTGYSVGNLIDDHPYEVPDAPCPSDLSKLCSAGSCPWFRQQ